MNSCQFHMYTGLWAYHYGHKRNIRGRTPPPPLPSFLEEYFVIFLRNHTLILFTHVAFGPYKWTR